MKKPCLNRAQAFKQHYGSTDHPEVRYNQKDRAGGIPKGKF
jgi:hypothetical protein